MEFTAARSEMVREAGLAIGAVETKTTIPILANFKLAADGEKVELTATDLERALTTNFGAKVKTSGSTTVPARRFLEILKALPEGDVHFKVLENHWVEVKSGKAKFKLPGMAVDNFPVVPKAPKDDAVIQSVPLATAITRTSFAISREESRYTLNGALLRLNHDSLTVVATDGHRLALANPKAEVGGTTKEIRTLVPKAALDTLRSLLAQRLDALTVGFAQDDNHLFFQVGHRTLAAQRLTGQFPNYEAVLPKENNRAVTVDAAALNSALKRVGLLADERSSLVKFTVSEGKIEIATGGPDGEANDFVDAEYSGDPVTIGFNHLYVAEFIGAVEGKVRLSFKDANTAGDFAPEAGEYRYVVMPMRI